MKSQAIKSALAGLLISALSIGIALAGEARPTREVRSKARSAQADSPKVLQFRTDKTDSWLCQHVSAFFCTDLFPTLVTRPDSAPAPSGAVPDRSRR